MRGPLAAVALTALVGGGAAVALAIRGAPERASATTSEQVGVDQLRMHRTADGHLLDLRYRIVAPERAGSLLGKDTKAYLVHDRSGTRLAVPTTPKAGSLRSTGVPRAGRAYFALFSNPGRRVQRGDQVSIVLGDLTASVRVE